MKKKIKDWIYNKFFKEEYETKPIYDKPIIVSEKRNIHEYYSRICLPSSEIVNMRLQEDELMYMMKQKLADKFYDVIYENMEIRRDYDVMEMMHVFTARIEMVERNGDSEQRGSNNYAVRNGL